MYVRYTSLHFVLANPIQVPSFEIDRIFEDSSDMQEQQLLIQGISILLCILRFFRYADVGLRMLTYADVC